jgi:hypothetical protein
MTTDEVPHPEGAGVAVVEPPEAKPAKATKKAAAKAPGTRRVLDGGVWVAHDSDNVIPFAAEIDALRYAVEHGLVAKFVPFGTAVADA